MCRNDLLVIVVTYNGMQWIERCLRSVAESSYPADVIVVDNGSTDGTQDYIQNNFPNVEFIQSKENLGFGAANNIGFRKALKEGYGFIYLLNQDAWVELDTFRILIDSLGENKEYGLVSPIQVNGRGDLLDKNFFHNILTRDLASDAIIGSLKSIYPVDDVMAAHWMMTNECLESVGGFSPIYKHYGEDNNWAWRAIKKGYKIGIVTYCLGYHDREDRKAMSKSKIIYFNRVESLVRIGSGTGLVREMGIELRQCLSFMLRLRSIKPLKNVFHTLYNWRRYKKLYDVSLSDETPFI